MLGLSCLSVGAWGAGWVFQKPPRCLVPAGLLCKSVVLPKGEPGRVGTRSSQEAEVEAGFPCTHGLR